MFGVEGDRLALGGDAGERGRCAIGGAGGLGHGARLRLAQQEGGVRGKHDMRQRPLPARGESGEISRLGERFQPGAIDGGLHRGHQMRQVPRAGGEALGLQLGYQCFKIIEGGLARLQPPR